ncbi:MAG: D-alanyl-D-alanine carboxypeptidase/D-alanyl-D-alanine-endopeptidase [Acidimicrobiia bacterium]|nr:D-alanyl-D-alanine carboxypeptidase/D-alanyl-D-alanine-endopeptidase [Acidimicrobiia bacterium]
MEIGRIIRLVAAPLVLAAVAIGAWGSAENYDFEDVSGTRVDFDARVESAILSARRIPQTLRAPISDDLLAEPLSETIAAYEGRSCLTVLAGDRRLEPSVDPEGGLIPASNQKLLTTFAALELLGPDFVFTTSVRAGTQAVEGVIEGDLYLVGDGDPFLTTDNWMDQFDDTDGRTRTRLEDLADAVVSAGVGEITGAVVGDESLYDDERYGPWATRLIDQKQSGPLSALTVNEGFVDWPDRFAASARSRTVSDNPPLDAAAVFASLLEERGVIIESGVDAGTAPAGLVVVASIKSPPLVDVITHINSYSSNIGAELLLKRLGLVAGPSGSTAAGAEVVRQTLTELGLPMADVVIQDGSGLAESDRVTCNLLAGLLLLAQDEAGFAESLAVSGVRGSLEEKFDDPGLVGEVLAKTGTLQGVRALSGYAGTDDDELPVTFAHVINDPGLAVGDPQLPTQEALLDALVDYPEGPAVEVLSPLPAVPTE